MKNSSHSHQPPLPSYLPNAPVGNRAAAPIATMEGATSCIAARASPTFLALPRATPRRHRGVISSAPIALSRRRALLVTAGNENSNGGGGRGFGQDAKVRSPARGRPEKNTAGRQGISAPLFF